jgi:hypothetical protein
MKDNSLNAERLAVLRAAIQDDIESGRYFGGVIAVARRCG